METATAQRSTPYDVQLLFPVLLLVGVGIVMIYSASSTLAMDRYQDGYHFLKRQGAFAALGLVVLVCCRHFPYRLFRPLAYPLMFLALWLLVLVLVPGFGKTAGGATRWLHLGTFSLQPSEAARFAITVFLAFSLSKKQETVDRFSIGFVPHALMLSLIGVPILMQPDFGSVVILTLITGTMMFVGGVPLTQLLAAGALVVPVGAFVALSAEYRVKRLMSFINPWDYPSTDGYQVIHSLMAFGSGGSRAAASAKASRSSITSPNPTPILYFPSLEKSLD